MSDYSFNPILDASEIRDTPKRSRKIHDECKCGSDDPDDFYHYKDGNATYVRKSMCKKCYSEYQMNLRNKN